MEARRSRGRAGPAPGLLPNARVGKLLLLLGAAAMLKYLKCTQGLRVLESWGKQSSKKGKFGVLGSGAGSEDPLDLWPSSFLGSLHSLGSMTSS